MEVSEHELKTKILNFGIKGDDRGSLIALEGDRNIPFDIRRVYYIFGTSKGTRRGAHAHRNLQQVLIALNGCCKVDVNDGFVTSTVELDSPSKGLLINGLIWREMYDFSSDCVLIVLASELYNENDYIRSYDLFLKEMRSEQIHTPHERRAI